MLPARWVYSGHRAYSPPHSRLASSRMDDPDFAEGDYEYGGDPDSLSSAPGRVASIVSAAEAAAADLREQAESRANARIAEADRAADNRVRRPTRRPKSCWPPPAPRPRR